MNADEKQIREVVATSMAATKAEDYATVLGLMTDDAVQDGKWRLARDANLLTQEIKAR